MLIYIQQKRKIKEKEALVSYKTGSSGINGQNNKD